MEKYPLTNTSIDLIVLPCLSFTLPLLSFALAFHFPVFLPFEDFIVYLEAVQRWKEERMKGWEKQDEASRGRQKWIGKRKVEMGRWRGGGGDMGPVVVDTSATGAAEMEGDA